MVTCRRRLWPRPPLLREHRCHMCVCVCMYMCVCMYVCLTWKYTHRTTNYEEQLHECPAWWRSVAFVFTHTHTHTHPCIHTHTHTHTHTHAHTHGTCSGPRHFLWMPCQVEDCLGIARRSEKWLELWGGTPVQWPESVCMYVCMYACM